MIGATEKNKAEGWESKQNLNQDMKNWGNNPCGIPDRKSEMKGHEQGKTRRLRS